MTYVEGFVVAVPTANRDVYRKHAAGAAPLFQEFGATRMVEAWGDDVKRGKVTDFYGAVQAKEDESVVFSWFEYPDRATRDAANERMMSDPRMEQMGAEMPFDGQRMIFSGFDAFVDESGEGRSGYVDGFILPVPEDKRQAYHDMASKAAETFRKYGAVRIVEAWGDDVREGKVTDYYRAVKAEPGENVVFSWIEWPDKATRDAANQKMMSDPRMKQMGATMPFDRQRMIFGGFDSFVEEGTGDRGSYIDGFVLPVPSGKRQAYNDMASKAAAKFREYGAIRDVEAWGDDVPDGKVTDFKRAVKAQGDEKVVFSFIEWPDKETRDAGWKQMMEDPDMQPDKHEMPFDGQRMFWGGFSPLLDTAAETATEREPA